MGDEDYDEAIRKIQEVQEQIEKTDADSSDAVLAVERRFNEIRKPLYAQRNNLAAAIPDFWFRAFTHHPIIGQLLTNDDRNLFHKLTAVDVIDNPDIRSGYKIMFTFDTNDYFTNEQVTKDYAFEEDGELRITSSAIHWHEGMNLTEAAAAKAGNKRPRDGDESFTKWFVSDETLQPGVCDEIADFIKNDIWAQPIKYYLGTPEALYDDEGGEDGDDGDDDGEEGDEEGDEEGHGVGEQRGGDLAYDGGEGGEEAYGDDAEGDGADYEGGEEGDA